MAENRPRGRQKNISGPGKSVYKRGSGLGTGPVGNSGGYSGRGSGDHPVAVLTLVLPVEVIAAQVAAD